MIGSFFAIFVLLIIMAALMRDDFAFTLIYLLIGAFVIGTWWSRRSLSKVDFQRKVTEHAFLGDAVEIKLDVRNQGLLPVLWMDIQDALPVALSSAPSFERVISLGPRDEAHFTYSLDARKRGYYPIGPLFLSSGDLLGFNNALQREGETRYLTVYPKIVPLTSIQIPSQSPQGTLRHTRPVFEDPTRIWGKRDYTSGDSLRRVDWKATAATGRLQVRLFEPSIALETVIFLDLNAESYHFRGRIDSIELAVVIAASISAWVTEKKQAVGLHVNGKDLQSIDTLPRYLPPRKGQAHLIRILETLARVDMVTGTPLTGIIQRQRYHLPWGTTLIVITGQAGDDLLNELYQARRAGQNVVLILAGMGASDQETTRKAQSYGIPVVVISDEDGMDIWRK